MVVADMASRWEGGTANLCTVAAEDMGAMDNRREGREVVWVLVEQLHWVWAVACLVVFCWEKRLTEAMVEEMTAEATVETVVMVVATVRRVQKPAVTDID